MTEHDLDLVNLPLFEEYWQAWQSEPASVPDDWRTYFERGEVNFPAGENGSSRRIPLTGGVVRHPEGSENAQQQGRIDSLIWAYRDMGYLHADLNPLRGYITPGLQDLREAIGGEYENLSPEEFGLHETDVSADYSAGLYLKPARGSVNDILQSLRQTYCGPIGVEYLHIHDRDMRQWLIENIETNNNQPRWHNEQMRTIQNDLIRAEEFERFIHSHFVGQKRFSLEGSEALIPALHYLIDRAAYEAGVEELVLGMTHRGRLNVLVNLLGKPAAGIFATFSNEEMPFTYTGSGDVRYHLGFSVDHINPDNSSIHVGLVANPSHLEAVDAVVEGKARGIQRKRGDEHRKKVIPILIHGDSAFSGQGVVAETFNMSQLRGYRTGGTIHIIVNNQIGFTTASRDSRSTFFPTDVAKSMPVPIIHVNGDCPAHVVRAMELAFRFRQEFAYDAVVDIFCYRKYGHNEADDPTFTHPVMYERIRELPSVAAQYGDELNASGDYPAAEQDAFREDYRSDLLAALKSAQSNPSILSDGAFQSEEWRGFTRAYDHAPVTTSLPVEDLRTLGMALCHIPNSLNLNPKLKRIVADRRQRYDQGTNIDWSSAEELAFASLLIEGTAVRLSGEDTARGTFSQRHAVWWRAEDGKPTPYCPFDYLADTQARFSAYDSPLSEYSVLGFEYGNSLAQPHMLTLWEAQFGDFCNGA
ncbi:MAG: thiamine pyrophosphate-dependent enzyme, partial [Verrucomicrobia bacterium]|nr:thiamine pyrophosphate-dependent enzyme [Verrucomicrobiota bacterium]